MKTCRICKETKEENHFQKNRRVCKFCRNEQSKKALMSNSERLNKLYEQRKLKRKENLELARQKGREYQNKYKNEDPEGFRNKTTKSCMKWRSKNKKKYNEYCKKLYQSNQNYRLGKLIRQRIREFLSGKKRLHTKELLGCSYKFLKEHLQYTAINNGYIDFDINTYKSEEFHIDHIIPCASFDLSKEEEQKKCFHWSNLQILTAEKNIIKGDKI